MIEQEDITTTDVVITPSNSTSSSPAHTPTIYQTSRCPIGPTVMNVIISADLRCCLDLREIAVSVRHAEFNPKRTHAVILRLRTPQCTALIFKTGRMMLSGCRNVASAKAGARKAARIVQRVGFPDVIFSDFQVENLVASADLQCPIRLEAMASSLKDRTHYEPELFSGCVVRFPEGITWKDNPLPDILPTHDEDGQLIIRNEDDEESDNAARRGEEARATSCTALVFVSGKVSITGARTIEELQAAFALLTEWVAPFAGSMVIHRREGGDEIAVEDGTLAIDEAAQALPPAPDVALAIEDPIADLFEYAAQREGA